METFSILGRFTRCARRANVPKETIDAVVAKAESSDYNHLLQTFIPWSSDGGDDDADAD